jgi:peroxiredoxin
MTMGIRITQRVIAILVGIVLSGTTQAAVRVGQPAPDFSGTDTRGQQHTLKGYRGQVVVLEWTNHDCPYVRKHYDSGNMQAHQREAAKSRVVWLSVISSAPGKQGHVTAARADELTTSRNASPSAVMLDPAGDIGRLYGARTTPHMYIIDRDGTLAYMGGIDSIVSADPDDIAQATAYTRLALREVVAGQPVKRAVTRPYGCSVKY